MPSTAPTSKATTTKGRFSHLTSFGSRAGELCRGGSPARLLRAKQERGCGASLAPAGQSPHPQQAPTRPITERAGYGQIFKPQRGGIPCGKIKFSRVDGENPSSLVSCFLRAVVDARLAERERMLRRQIADMRRVMREIAG